MRIHLLLVVLVVVTLMMVGLWGCGKKEEAGPTVGQEHAPGQVPAGFEEMVRMRPPKPGQQPAQPGQQQPPAPTGR